MSIKHLLKKNVILTSILGIITIVGIGVGVYFFIQYQNTQRLLQNPTLATQMQSKSLLEKVGKLIELPTDEDPTIATVSDFTKLQDQPFFQRAKNGFKVLIYTKARKAILYDPFENKIVEVAPVNLGQNQGSLTNPVGTATGATVTPSPMLLKVVLYNGTQMIGLTKKIGPQITAKFPNVTIADTDNASKDTYTQTLVVALSSAHPDLASQIAALLNGKVGVLPSSEKKPTNADILVILGK